ncbi:MAG: M20 family metallopeptidase [Defluviitaleaceae bacterium]|nr:M20 family metallopeptidase [Defluviitaleaceae bacterium]
MDFILKRAAEIQEEIAAHRRYFHENAEIHNELPLTCAYVMEKLKEMGYEPKQIAKTGVVAVVGKKPGKTFMIRADMDALPMGEETDEPFKSKTPHMHSCGHDLHTAMLLGAAKILKENEDKINGQIKLMFQPAEETLWGANAMIQDGLMENPKVDAAMMIHVRTAADGDLATGDISFSTPGVSNSSSDGFRVDIKGKGGHGARPQVALDPLTTAAHILINLQEILAKEIAPTDEAVINICHMEGGSATNIIPDTALMQGTIRTFDPNVREFILKRVPEIVDLTAKLFRTEAELTWLMSTPSVINDEKLFYDLLGYAKETFGANKVLNISELRPKEAKGAGSEDFAFVSALVPAVALGLVAGTEKDGYTYGGHHPKVRYDESALKTGASMYAVFAMKWLEDNS